MRKVIGINLRGRDLRFADFSETLMPKADFQPGVDGEPTKLQSANFSSAQLQGANLEGSLSEFVNLQAAAMGSIALEEKE